MIRVLALADDLTGALEVGASFAGEGISSTVTTDATFECLDPVIVIDTETRHLAPEAAAAKVQQALRAAHHASVRLIFKKTDSTLRGNIQAELETLAGFYGTRVLYAPAYPAMGRTVKQGRLYVNGIPLEQSSFATDPLNPVTDSRVAQGPFCEVMEDIEIAAARILETAAPSLGAGTGALAGALAAKIEIQRSQRSSLPAIRSCLIVNGSLHEISARQVAHFAHKDWTVMQWTAQKGQTSLEIADENGRRIRCALREAKFDAVLICGGDTAYGMLKAVGFPPIRPIGEVVPGVAISRIAIDGCDLHLITKAGGFGDVDILNQIRKKLNAEEQ
jgi:uncharacterized protein YgbK (DUF1537 family)